MKYIIFFCLFFATHFCIANDLDPKNYSEKAEIKLLDRLEEHSKTIELTKNSIVVYKNLEITLEACWKSPKNKNEHMAKILIIEFPKNKKTESNGKNIFHGWIAKENKKVSNLKHRLYQMHLSRCVFKD